MVFFLVDFRWLVGKSPDIGQAHRRMEAIEDGQRHRQMRNDTPLELSIKEHLAGVGFGALDLEGAEGPHGHVADNQKGDHLPARLLFLQTLVVGASAQSVKDEGCLQDDLHHRGRVDHDRQRVLGGDAGYNAKEAENEETGQSDEE